MESIVKRAPVLLLVAIVAATLTTAYIHYTLGGLLFLLNALGYVGLAGLIVVPIGFVQRLRPLVLLALAGYTVTTIVGWLVMGPYFTLAYITKGVELVLLGLIGTQLFRTRSEIVPAFRFARALGFEALRIALRRPAAPAAAGETGLAGATAPTSET
ncbi:MAG: hypothetical protein M3N29_02180 [Chloroflexota bacterium]|nr:hypothetical protein [Chloroflexota bacterium]